MHLIPRNNATAIMGKLTTIVADEVIESAFAVFDTVHLDNHSEDRFGSKLRHRAMSTQFPR